MSSFMQRNQFNQTTDPSGNCVAYNISFYLNETLLSKLLDFRCGIPRCILELIAFECTLSGKNVGVYSYETSSKKDEPKDTNCENDLSHGNKILILIKKKYQSIHYNDGIFNI